MLDRILLAALGQRLLRDLAEHAVDNLGHGGAAEQPLQVRDGHLARTKAADADLRLFHINWERDPAFRAGRG